MKTLADAIVYATNYINLRTESDADDDVGALESISAYLAEATESEKDALADAAKRALKAEISGPNRDEWISDLSSWMEDMFAEGWEGNDRTE